jgi:rSAM/selenodomain-associated transferase 1
MDRNVPAGPAKTSAALVILAKAPIPGQVKTRLCPPLTEDEAATLHGSFVLDTLERTKRAASSFKLPIDRFLACAPSRSHVFFRIMEARHGVTLLDQPGDDLGERMHHIWDRLLTQGYQRISFVGTDVPSLPLTYYRDALAALTRHELAIGPTTEGGCYLIGVTATASDIFESLPWPSDRLAEFVEEKAAVAGREVAVLPTWREVDRVDDLRALIDEQAVDKKRPKQERVFSARTSGTLELLAKRLSTRHV